jgi:hypothetical protein
MSSIETNPNAVASPGANAEATLLETVAQYIAAIEGLKLKEDRGSTAQADARDKALTGLRQALRRAEMSHRSELAGAAARHADDQDEITRASHRRRALEQQVRDVAFAGDVAQQLARLLELELHVVKMQIGRKFAIKGEGFSADLSFFRDEQLGIDVRTLVVGNPDEGKADARIILGPDGLTDEAVQRLSGLFGVHYTLGNTPRHLRARLFTPKAITAWLEGGLGMIAGILLGRRSRGSGSTPPPPTSC